MTTPKHHCLGLLAPYEIETMSIIRCTQAVFSRAMNVGCRAMAKQAAATVEALGGGSAELKAI